MVQYHCNWGSFFNNLRITQIDLYKNGNEFIYVNLVKIIQKIIFAIEITIVHCLASIIYLPLFTNFVGFFLKYLFFQVC